MSANGLNVDKKVHLHRIRKEPKQNIQFDPLYGKNKRANFNFGPSDLFIYLSYSVCNAYVTIFTGTSRGLEALQNHMNDSYYKSVLC